MTRASWCLLPCALLAAPAFAQAPCGFAEARGDLFARGVARPDDATRSWSSSLVPLMLHTPAGFSEYDARLLLQALEAAWQANRAWGMELPPTDGFGPDTRYDAYVTTLGTVGGLVRPESYEPGDDGVACASHLELNRDVPLDALVSIVHHELRHAFQLATDCTESSAFAEADATFVQDWSAPELSLGLAQFGPAFQAAPARALNGFDDGGAQQYGAALFRWYLAERFGDGTPASATILWQGGRQPGFDNEPDWMDALRGWLVFTGEDLDEAVAEFARWRLQLGDGGPWAAAESWPDLPLAEHARHDVAAFPVDAELPVSVEPWGTGHVVLTGLPESGKIEWVVAPEGDAWAMQLLGKRADGGWTESTMRREGDRFRLRLDVSGLVEVHLLATSLALHDPDEGPVFERVRDGLRYVIDWPAADPDVVEPTPAPEVIGGGRAAGCAVGGGWPLLLLFLRRRR